MAAVVTHSAEPREVTPQKPKRSKSAAHAEELAKPKRAKSAYAFFCNEERTAAAEEVRARGDGKLVLAELGKEMSRRWAEADAATRERCKQLAEQDAERHASAMREYVEATDPVGAHTAKCAHMIPKRPLSAYFRFVQDKAQRAKAEEALRAEGQQVTAGAMGSRLGQMWHAAEAEVKEAFTIPAEKARAEYEARNKEWRSTTDFSRLEELRRSSKEAKRKASAPAIDADKPNAVIDADKPPRTPRKVRRRLLSTLDIDSAVLVEAQQLGLEAPLLAMANRKEVQDEGICARTTHGAQKLLSALIRTRGSVDLDALLAFGEN